MRAVRHASDSALKIPPPPGGSEKPTPLPRQGLDLYAQSVDSTAEMAQTVDKLLRSAPRRDVKKLRDLRDLRARLLESALPSGRDVTPAQVREARRGVAERLAEAARSAGVDESEMREAGRRIGQELKRAQPADPKGSDLLKVVPEPEVPEAIRTHQTNPWAYRTPPYDGWEWWWNYAEVGFYDPEFTAYTDKGNGSIGQRSAWSIWDADDWNYADLRATSLVGFWIKPQTAGQIEIWLKARCGSAQYLFDGYDEWGWSDYWQSHSNYWAVGVSSSTDLDTQFSWGTYFNGPDEEYDYAFADNYPPNTVKWLYFKTSEALAANSWYYLRFGTTHKHVIFSNDETIYASSRNRWYIESTEWRTVGT